MFNIISQSTPDLSKVDIYRMTRDPQIQQAKNLEDGTILEVAAWLEFEDVKQDGDNANLLSILTTDGTVVTTQSQTFKNSFHEVDELMAGDPYSIEKISGTTKAGRPYVNCRMA